jgi:hypothetical protein
MTNFEIALDRLREKEGFECHGNLDDRQIISMEKELGISFPESYKVFLKKYGYAEWFGHTIYGYAEDEDYHTVACTIELREDEIPHDFQRVPNEGCVLEIYGGGGCYFLFSKESNRAGQVALFLDELNGNEAELWSTFELFLDYMLTL